MSMPSGLDGRWVRGGPEEDDGLFDATLRFGLFPFEVLKRRFQELADSPEGMASNILSNRLKRLEDLGVVERVWYQERPPQDAYRLTEKGRELEPILVACMRWGRKHLPHTRAPES